MINVFPKKIQSTVSTLESDKKNGFYRYHESEIKNIFRVLNGIETHEIAVGTQA